MGMCTSGQPFAVLPKSSPASLNAQSPGVVAGAAEENSSLVTFNSGNSPLTGAARLKTKAVKALAEVHLLTVHFAVEACVANGSVDPVVEAVMKVARPGVRVVRRPTGEEHLPQVGLAVAVGVLEEERVRSLMDNHTPGVRYQARGNAQLVRECGDLVANALAVGVFTHDDACRDPFPRSCMSFG